MAVSIPGDMVLEVAQSRRPERYARILERLKTGSPMDVGVNAPNSFNVVTGFNAPLIVNHLTQSGVIGKGTASEGALAFRKLEAQLVKHLLETMLPASAAGGKSASTANGYWKSTLADTLAQKMSESGQIGLAAKLHEAFDRKVVSISPVGDWMANEQDVNR